MRFFSHLIRTLSVAAILTGASPLLAQEAATVPKKPVVRTLVEFDSPAPRVYTETFDGDDMSLMLGGHINFPEKDSEWLVYVTGGKLVLENKSNPRVLHYNDITWVKYPDPDTLETTENAVISVVVDGQNEGMGGVGLIVGSGKGGHYVMFSVDGEGRYHIFRKDGRKARPVHSAKHPAVRISGPNQLTFKKHGKKIAFIANGTEIIRVLAAKRGLPKGEGAGVGLAAFGLGKYTIDSVVITQERAE